MNVRLHPCSEHHPKSCYHAETVFELDSWCQVLSLITAAAKPIHLPVAVHWTAGYHELRGIPGKETPAELGVAHGDFDPDCTWLVEAAALKCLQFHGDSWHPDRRIRSKAISAYLRELPDEWPVIVHYT